MKRAALISVSDKTGLIPFAKALKDFGYELLGTTGSKSYLKDSGIEVISIEEYTSQKEILGGRVKTLHPKIHAGLLAKRSDPEHMKQLEVDGIYPIDIAVINLYPFTQNMTGDAVGNPEKMIELIDVGGPTMIRAAAKNFSSVLPVLDPADYERVIAVMKNSGGSVEKVPLEFRRELAAKVFTFVSNYDLGIARYLTNVDLSGVSKLSEGTVSRGDDFLLGKTSGFVLEKGQELRYGENPHQRGAFYLRAGASERLWEQLNGKELSYNNFLDFDAALRLVQSFPTSQPACAIMKHLNPCGAAVARTPLEAVQRAKLSDPRSHFGGVLAFNSKLPTDAAEAIAQDFAEIVIAPDFEPSALDALRKSKNLRILKCVLGKTPRFEIRSVAAGILIQESDPGVSNVREAEMVSERKPTDQELADLAFAWTVCSHVKSNSIVLAKDGLLVGVGAGQMSRVDSAELAVSKAKTHHHSLEGAVAASDAFFPFTDSIEFLSKNGVKAIIAPKGAKKDDEVVRVCNDLKISLLFTGDRHFRH